MRLKLALYADIFILLRNLLNCYYSCYLPPETICMVQKKKRKKAHKKRLQLLSENFQDFLGGSELRQRTQVASLKAWFLGAQNHQRLIRRRALRSAKCLQY